MVSRTDAIAGNENPSLAPAHFPRDLHFLDELVPIERVELRH
jgi:hypothetical protein